MLLLCSLFTGWCVDNYEATSNVSWVTEYSGILVSFPESVLINSVIEFATTTSFLNHYSLVTQMCSHFVQAERCYAVEVLLLNILHFVYTVKEVN
jgi:hypothetical protein